MEWMPPPDGIAMCHSGDVLKSPKKERTSMTEVTMIGIDLAKRVFQAHGAAAALRNAVSRRRKECGLELEPRWPCCDGGRIFRGREVRLRRVTSKDRSRLGQRRERNQGASRIAQRSAQGLQGLSLRARHGLFLSRHPLSWR